MWFDSIKTSKLDTAILPPFSINIYDTAAKTKEAEKKTAHIANLFIRRYEKWAMYTIIHICAAVNWLKI